MFLFRSNISKCLRRAMSTNFIDMNVDQEGIATIAYNRRPVNSISLEVVQELLCKLDEVQKNKYKAIIMTSALPTIYSAGLDLYEFHKADAQRFSMFWTALQELFLKLYSSPYISTVAINGYTGAGACVISLMCDYRVMVKDDKARIGINDTSIGVVPVDWVRELIIRTVGLREAETAITASKMYSVNEALKVHLVDEVACDHKDAIEKCKNYIRSFNNIPIKARITAKNILREGLVKHVFETQSKSLELMLKNVLDPDVQKHVAMYVDDVKQRKNKIF